MFFVVKICKRALRASIEGYLAVAASTPTYSDCIYISYIFTFMSIIWTGTFGIAISKLLYKEHMEK